MTPEAALKNFFNSAIAGVKAYQETAVPSKAHGYSEDVAFPYLTYSLSFAALDEGVVSLTIHLYFYTEDETPANAASRTLSRAIGRDGVKIHCDGGYICLTRGTPFSQAVDEADRRLKHRYINITAEYLVLD